MLRRDYTASHHSFDDIVDFVMAQSPTRGMMLVDPAACVYCALSWYQRAGRHLIDPAVYLLIVAPSGEVRTLRDADIGLDVLPADWHEKTGEELFALGKPFAFGGEEPKVKLSYVVEQHVKNFAMERRTYQLCRSGGLWESISYYSCHQDRIDNDKRLLIVAPSGAHRLLRDRKVGIDVLPEQWATMTGEALFDLALPCGGEVEPPADRLPPPPDALIDNEEVKVDIGAASRPVDVRKPLVISVAAKNNEPAFEVPDVAAIARKAARERVEHLRSVRDAIGWPFV